MLRNKNKWGQNKWGQSKINQKITLINGVRVKLTKKLLLPQLFNNGFKGATLKCASIPQRNEPQQTQRFATNSIILTDVTHEKAIVHEKHERHELRGAQQTL